jgi:hypothetical protein
VIDSRAVQKISRYARIIAKRGEQNDGNCQLFRPPLISVVGIAKKIPTVQL